jgi:formylglycine-generating enzyme required for sulfatase activity
MSFVAALRESYTAQSAIAQEPAVIPREHPSKRGPVIISALMAARLLGGTAVAWKRFFDMGPLRRVAPATLAQKAGSPAPAQAVQPAPTIGIPAKSDPSVRAAAATFEKKQEERAPAKVTAKETLAVALPPATAKPGETTTNRVDGLRYVWVPPGSFLMGCSPDDNECMDDEKPAHRVTISKGFWLGQTEVIEDAYRKVTGKDGGLVRRGQRPVHSTTWEEARDYCTAVGMRLPTEAEWEYAARAGSTGSRHGELDKIAWFEDNSDRQTHNVATKEPNAWGLYDMLGNVAEFTADWFGRYAPGAATDPLGPAVGRFRVRRGGVRDLAPRWRGRRTD